MNKGSRWVSERPPSQSGVNTAYPRGYMLASQGFIFMAATLGRINPCDANIQPRGYWIGSTVTVDLT